VVEGQRTLACLGLRDRDAGGGGERVEGLGGVRVDDPPAGDDERPAGRADASTARASAAASGSGRPTCQVRSANSSTGQSKASACTSCGKHSVTAPVSAGSVSTRIADNRAPGSCSGRQMRSKYRDTGRKASFTVTSPDAGSSSSCSSDPADRVAKVSAGSRSTGSRLIVASAAPVSMLVEPGPTLVDSAQVCSRSFARA
jgi:hypothetical protein